MSTFVSAAEIDSWAGAEFGSRFEPLGFRKVTLRRWVRSAKAPIRELVEIHGLKGASYVPFWGLSLDFVPHVSGSRVASHRTEKSARLDLVVNPCDWFECDRFRFSRIDSRRHERGHRWRRAPSPKRKVALVADATLEVAVPWFDKVSGIDSVVAAYEEAKARPTLGLGFDSYTQHGLAYAFVLAAAGNTERARTEFNAWLALHDTVSDKMAAGLASRLSATAALSRP